MLTIPEMVVAEVDKSILEEDSDRSRSILFAGSKSTGKTTAIHNFLDKRESVRETLALEYSFGRKSKEKQSAEKNICHIWEYGGKLELLEEVMSCVPKQGPLTIVIMLDLSKPRRVWPTLESCLVALDRVSTGATSGSISIMIVGGKYDLFKNFESDVKRNVCATLRSVGIIYSANILLYSAEDPTLAKKLKQCLYLFGFGVGSFPKEKSVNHNKPMCVASGSDSWESLGLSESSLEQVKMRHFATFPMELEDLAPSPNVVVPSSSSHAEPLLDAIRKKKYDDMLEMIDISTIDYLNTLK